MKIESKNLIIIVFAYTLYLRSGKSIEQLFYLTVTYFYLLNLLIDLLTSIFSKKRKVNIPELPDEIKKDILVLEEKIKNYLNEKCSNPHCEDCYPDLNEH